MGRNTMNRLQRHQPPHPKHDVPEDFEPGAPPIDPDEGPVPVRIPDDAEHERVIDPAAQQDPLDERIHRQLEVTRCP
jgi:hypothetical protein